MYAIEHCLKAKQLKGLLSLSFSVFLLSFFAQQAHAQQSCPKWGPYVKALHTPGEARLMMADVMIPANGMAPYTYACSIQFRIGKSGGYCGIQNTNGSHDARRPLNNIFSIWDFPNKKQIVCVYKDPLAFVGGFGNEGTGLHAHTDFGWIPGHWYTNVVRCWSTGSNHTFVGYWILDNASEQWRHYVTFSIPQTDARLHGDMASFLENFADQTKKTRTAYYKSYWVLRTDGKWAHPDTLFAQAGEGAWTAERYGEDGVKITSCGAANGPSAGYRFAVQMPDRPDIALQPTIYDLGAYYDHQMKKVYVDWSVQPTSTPQLSYHIALYDNRELSGSPLAAISGTDPDKTMATLPVSAINLKEKNYYVTLQIKDIFAQKSVIKKFTLRNLNP